MAKTVISWIGGILLVSVLFIPPRIVPVPPDPHVVAACIAMGGEPYTKLTAYYSTFTCDLQARESVARPHKSAKVM